MLAPSALRPPTFRSRSRAAGVWLAVAVTSALMAVPLLASAQTPNGSDAEAETGVEAAEPEEDGAEEDRAEEDRAEADVGETATQASGADADPSVENEPPADSPESAEPAPTQTDSGDAAPAQSTETEPPPPVLPAGPLTPPGGVPEILDPNADEPRPQPRRAPPEPPEPPAEPLPTSSIRVEIQPRFNLLTGSTMDDALRAHRYVANGPLVGGHVGAAFSVAEPWFWIGGRLGLRGRTWRHPDRDGPVATAGDLQLTVGVRGDVDQVVEFGAVVHAGVGVVDLRVNGVAAGQVVPRFGFEGVLAFRVGPNFSFGPRVGWEYFQWDGVNEDGHWLELGGPFLGLSLEGRL